MRQIIHTANLWRQILPIACNSGHSIVSKNKMIKVLGTGHIMTYQAYCDIPGMLWHTGCIWRWDNRFLGLTHSWKEIQKHLHHFYYRSYRFQYSTAGPCRGHTVTRITFDTLWGWANQDPAFSQASNSVEDSWGKVRLGSGWFWDILDCCRAL